ncbi:hypothetical protein ABZ355_04755, partial [Streptomyces sp. NPDC005989]
AGSRDDASHRPPRTPGIYTRRDDTGAVPGAVPKLGAPEQAVTEISLPVRRRRPVRAAFRTAGPAGGAGQSNAYASTSDR